MAAFQLLLLPLLWSTPAAAYPPRHPGSCQIVQTDVLCRDLGLRGAPGSLPQHVNMLDLSHNQVENLAMETLAHRRDLRHLNLRSNKIHFVQPGLFKDMTNLKTLDLSRNHLNLFAQTKTHIGPLAAVESLDLSSNGLYTGMTDYLVSACPSLLNLSLSSNSITKVAQNTFSGSPSLRRINLHNNVVLEIEDGAFDSLKHLDDLDLSKNSISCITDFNLSRLKLLNLSQNSVELFQSVSSTQPYSLHTLDLSQNKMHYFPLLPTNNVIEFLDLSRNRLLSLNVSGSPQQKAAVVLNHLQVLDLSYNQLRSLPESFLQNMDALSFLNVSNNCIKSFSVADHPLRSIRVMDLGYNSLQSLSIGPKSLPLLEELFLQGNALSTLDHHTFQRLPSVRLLQLQQNDLKVCEEEPSPPWIQRRPGPPGCVFFTAIPSLEFLYLSENNLRRLPAGAFTDTQLKLLDLSLNPGLDVDEHSLSGLEDCLVHLLLKESNISKLNTDLNSLQRLRYVDLSTNHLMSLPLLTQESTIESLNVQNNNLVTLDYRTILALEHSLKTLYMGSNPLSCCSNLGFLHLVQHSSVVVPDIEAVTCAHKESSHPVSIETVTKEMCDRQSGQSNTTVIVVIVLLVVLILVALLAKWCHMRRRKHARGFSA
ncbi:transforming growth factor beta activator LRRC32 isoform 1-T2 [Synchiropus picturatus]